MYSNNLNRKARYVLISVDMENAEEIANDNIKAGHELLLKDDLLIILKRK